jgi:NADPH:quinone reductase-like Zn-dependent oxidoreductase
MPRTATFIRQLFNPLLRTQVFGLLTRGNGDQLAYLASLVDTGQLRPVVDRVLPIGEVAAAQDYSKSGRAKGKIVLTF